MVTNGEYPYNPAIPEERDRAVVYATRAAMSELAKHLYFGRNYQVKMTQQDRDDPIRPTYKTIRVTIEWFQW